MQRCDLSIPRIRVNSCYFYFDIHARRTRMDCHSADLHNLANEYRLKETDTSCIHRYAVLTAPTCRARISGLINLLHYCATVYLASKIDVCGLCKEP